MELLSEIFINFCFGAIWIHIIRKNISNHDVQYRSIYKCLKFKTLVFLGKSLLSYSSFKELIKLFCTIIYPGMLCKGISKKYFHTRHTCSKKGVWSNQVKPHMCWSMMLKIQTYVFHAAKKLQNAEIEIFLISKMLILPLKKFSFFPRYCPKWLNLSQVFFEKYDSY